MPQYQNISWSWNGLNRRLLVVVEDQVLLSSYFNKAHTDLSHVSLDHASLGHASISCFGLSYVNLGYISLNSS